MFMNQEREIESRISLTLAESTVLGEQCAALVKSVNALRIAVGQDDGVGMSKSWNTMTEHMNYIGTLLSIKGSAAARAYMTEQEE